MSYVSANCLYCCMPYDHVKRCCYQEEGRFVSAMALKLCESWRLWTVARHWLSPTLVPHTPTCKMVNSLEYIPWDAGVSTFSCTLVSIPF